MKTNVSSKSCVISRTPRMKRARTCFIVLVAVAICAACVGAYATLNSAYADVYTTIDRLKYKIDTSTKQAAVYDCDTKERLFQSLCKL